MLKSTVHINSFFQCEDIDRVEVVDEDQARREERETEREKEKEREKLHRIRDGNDNFWDVPKNLNQTTPKK